MMQRRHLVALALLVSVLPMPGYAATFRIDDSSTIPAESSAVMRWRSFAPSRGGDNNVEGTTTVQVRLNVAPWQKRTGRIFLVLPEQPPGQVNVSWTTQGRLLPGQLVSGQRALVYSGPITAAFIEETLILRLQTDGNRLNSSYRLNFHFEIDVD